MDRTDPGFEIPGIKLRWLGARVEELSMDRPWVVLRKSDMPEKLIKHLLDKNPDLFREGDTIRRGTCILGYASLEAVQEHRKELNRAARDQYEGINRVPQGLKHIRKIDHESSTTALTFDGKEIKDGIDSGAERFSKG